MSTRLALALAAALLPAAAAAQPILPLLPLPAFPPQLIPQVIEPLEPWKPLAERRAEPWSPPARAREARPRLRTGSEYAVLPLAPPDAWPAPLIPQPIDPRWPEDTQAGVTPPVPPTTLDLHGSQWATERLSPLVAWPAQAVPAPVPPRVPDVAPWSPPAADPPSEQPESGVDLIERGVGALLDNLMREMAPTFESMGKGVDDLAARFGPTLQNLGTLIDDISNYQTPERLPNGDILIRRLPDAPPPPEIDLMPRPERVPEPPPIDPTRPSIEL